MSAGQSLSKDRRRALRKAWFGKRPVGFLARRFGVSERMIRGFWESERIAGRLPPAPAPRPHFAERCVVAAEVASEADVLDAEIGAEDFAADDAPIGGPMGLRIPDGDPLLCALRLVHGADPWRPLDGMPAQTLAMELDHPPSRGRAAELAATRDLYVAALMRRQPQGVH